MSIYYQLAFLLYIILYMIENIYPFNKKCVTIIKRFIILFYKIFKNIKFLKQNSKFRIYLHKY